MIDILVIFVAHCLADFPMQGEFITKWKSKSIYILLCHCAIYTVTVMTGMLLISLKSDPYAVDWKFIASVLFYTHFIIDYIKCNYRTKLYNNHEIDTDVDFDGSQQTDPEVWKRDKVIFYTDQILHLAIAISLVVTM